MFRSVYLFLNRIYSFDKSSVPVIAVISEKAKSFLPRSMAYNVYTDDILKKRKPNSVKPSPVYFVITSQGKVVKIKPAEKNSRFKVRNGVVVY